MKNNRVFKVDIASNQMSMTDEGYLKIPVYFSRVGIQDYKIGNETIKELRPPEEVFAENSMASFVGKPVTFLHPKEEVNPSNIKKYQIGHIMNFDRCGDGIRTEGDILVTHKSAIDYILDRKKAKKDVQLSCGYSVDLFDEVGEYEGQRFDKVQRNIKGNHVAIVSKGRAGDNVKMRLDSQQNDNKIGGFKMKLKLDAIAGTNIGSVTIDTDNADSVSEIIKDRESSVVSELKKLKADADKIQAKLDSAVDEKAKLETEKKELSEKLDSFNTTEKIDELLAAREELREVAKTAGVKIDGLEEIDAKKEIIKKVFDNADLEGKSDDYLNARFDSAVEILKEKKELDSVKKQRGGFDKKKDADEDREMTPAERLRARDAEINNLYKKGE